MCGIIGYIGKEDAVPILTEGLKRLEYRGYDSAGIAVFDGKKIDVVKRKGRIGMLEEALEEHSPRGNAGIGHTRWATHGEPSDINSHPHIGSGKKIAVVHNGIIENYKELRTRLEGAGINFASDTDTEVVAQLYEHYYDGDILRTTVKVATELKGSYAIAVLCADEGDKLIALKKDNPLIVGTSEKGLVIASDVPAVLKHTSNIYRLNDGEIAVLCEKDAEFFNFKLEAITKKTETIAWNASSAEKDGFPHFMLKEIFEQPRVLRDTAVSVLHGRNADVINSLEIKRFSRIVISACGSAYNAGAVGKYVFEKLCRFPIEVDIASEFRYRDAVIDKKTLVILISQSGETADTVAALREARRKGATTLSIVNVVGSTVAKETDYAVYTAAGPEIAVATTKAFSAQLIIIYALALRFARKLNTITPMTERLLFNEILSLSQKVSKILDSAEAIREYAAACADFKNIFFIGRNIDYAIALEGSLKLKEISYIHSEAYAGGELKHGTISLVEDNTLVVTLASCETLYPKILSNAEQVLSRGARVLFIGSSVKSFNEDIGCPPPSTVTQYTGSVSKKPYIGQNKSFRVKEGCFECFDVRATAFSKNIKKPKSVIKNNVNPDKKTTDSIDVFISAKNNRVSQIPLPRINDLFSPSLSVIVLQLFAYYIAAAKNLDIDKPRNLAKSVTVE